jgi:hypothetical protein
MRAKRLTAKHACVRRGVQCAVRGCTGTRLRNGYCGRHAHRAS